MGSGQHDHVALLELQVAPLGGGVGGGVVSCVAEQLLDSFIRGLAALDECFYGFNRLILAGA